MQNNQEAENHKEELITIIIAAHNSRELLVESVRSIQAQTYQNWELLIEDDHSDDGTISALMSILADDKRLHIYQTLQRKGTGRGRTSLLNNAHGRWVAFMECGDLWAPEKLEHQVGFMAQNGYLFSYTLCKKVYRSRIVTVGGPKTVDYEAMKKRCWPEHSTVMYNLKGTGIKEIGYSKSNNYYALWLRVSKKADCHLLDESLTTIMMERKKNRLSLAKKFRWRYEVYRIVERQNQIVSAYMTMRNIWYTLIERNKYVMQTEV